MDPAIVIAILSLLASLFTLFYSYLRPARIRCNFGPTITVFYDKKRYYDDRERKKGNPLYIFIPATIINLGSKAGSIFKVAITLHTEASPDKIYQLQWRQFCSNNRENNMWGYDEFAHEITVKGYSTEALP